ncbi:MAG: ABC transporter permease [Deltaproteobacteria bacterium]|nr:ABC transporter permease [Deltaproteobacteria bacterium]
MTRYIIQKLFSLVLVLLGISIVVFTMIRLVPGDVVDFLYGLYMGSERMNEIRALWGLDRPLVVQYLDWMGRVLQLDFGRSLVSGRAISEEILTRLPVTLHLSFMAAVWSVVFGITLGVIASRFPNGKIDGMVTTIGMLGLATPHFWLATLLVLVFAVYLGILPSIGYIPLLEDPIESTRSLVLPAVALGTTMAAAVMRMTRSAMLEVLSHDYIRTARAKGVAERGVFSRHALKNALIPVLTLIGTETGKLLGGSLIIEQIFAVPGIGQHAVEAVLSRDYPVLQATMLVIASSYVIINTLADIGYGVVDPRVRYD